MNWNNLPLEIIFQVLREIPNIYSCSLVNKKWHSIAHYLLYKELDIHLSTSTSLLHTLSHSQYRPGQCVSRLNLYLLEPHSSQDDNDDPLRALLRNCPHVREINFPLPLSLKEWQYFETSLCLSNNKYVTHIIYPFPFTAATYTHYLNCAFILQTSLRHLQLATRTSNYHHLKCFFKSVKTMDIRPGVLKNMVEYEHLVSLFHQLTSVRADFTLLDTAVETMSFPQSKSIIKNLNVSYSVPVSDMDLRLLKNKLFTVANLNLKFNRADPPDLALQSFFRCLTDVPNYKVSFTDTANQLILTMKNYYGSLLQSYNKVLDIRFVTQSPNTIEFTLNKTNHTVQVPSLTFTSKSNFNLKEISQATQSILTAQCLCRYFTTLRFFFDHHQSVHRHLVPTLSQELTHIDALVLTGGQILPVFHSASRQVNKAITKVTLNHSDLSWLESLNSFLFYFSTISLYLNQCKLHREPGTNQIKIKAPKVDLNDLYLSITHATTNSAYIKVQQGQAVKCYFLDTDIDEQYNLSQTIDSAMYHQHLLVSQKSVVFIHVHVKSLQKLTVCYNTYAYTLDATRINANVLQ